MYGTFQCEERQLLVKLELKTWICTFSNIISWNQQNTIKKLIELKIYSK